MFQILKDHFNDRIDWGIWVLKMSALVTAVTMFFFLLSFFLNEALALWLVTIGFIFSSVVALYLTKLRLKNKGY